MSVKEVLQSLVDDNLVDSERIGTSNYFWAYPSKAVHTVSYKMLLMWYGFMGCIGSVIVWWPGLLLLLVVLFNLEYQQRISKTFIIYLFTQGSLFGTCYTVISKGPTIKVLIVFEIPIWAMEFTPLNQKTPKGIAIHEDPMWFWTRIVRKIQALSS